MALYFFTNVEKISKNADFIKHYQKYKIFLISQRTKKLKHIRIHKHTKFGYNQYKKEKVMALYFF